LGTGGGKRRGGKGKQGGCGTVEKKKRTQRTSNFSSTHSVGRSRKKERRGALGLQGEPLPDDKMTEEKKGGAVRLDRRKWGGKL